MPNGKYRIRKTAYYIPVPGDAGRLCRGWWLVLPDGSVRVLSTWRSAIQAMDMDAARQTARSNRVPLGPIGKVTNAS